MKSGNNKVPPRFDIEENGMSCAPSWTHPDDLSYNLFLFTVGFFLPLSIILGTGVKILVIIKKVESWSGGRRGSLSLDLNSILFQHMNQLKMAGLKTQDKEQKVTQMVICLDAHCTYVAKTPSVQVVVMVSVYVFCWGPYAAQSLAAILGYAEVTNIYLL